MKFPKKLIKIKLINFKIKLINFKMGICDYISYVRRNGQNLDEFEFEHPYLYYLDINSSKYDLDDIDRETFKNVNLDINYNLLAKAIENNSDDCNVCGEGEGMIITHMYPVGTLEEDVEKFFFRTDILTPSRLQIDPSVDYRCDDWAFGNGYSIESDSKTGIWKLDFEQHGNVDLSEITFKPIPNFDYYAVAIDPPSLKYILNHNESDVPFGLLNDIIHNHDIIIDDSLTKRQVIDLVRKYFDDVSNYLNTYNK
jgi:hypothetical protein